MQRVYLDQNMWIYLACAYHGRARREGDREVLEFVIDAVERGLASFPLAAWNYMDLFKNRDAGRRARLGEVMHLVSCLHSIAHPTVLVPAEIEVALNRWFGRPSQLASPRVFGIGVNHAFGQPPVDFAEALELTPPSQRTRLRDEWMALYERSVLLGVPASAPQWERGFQAIIANTEAYADAETHRTELFHAWGRTDDRLDRLVVGVGIHDIIQPLIACFDRVRLSFEAFIDLGRDEVTRFFRELPIASALTDLKGTAYPNAQRRWQTGDLNDLSAASLSIVHCDVVAIEKHWGAAVKRAGLDGKHGTMVVTDLASLPEALITGSRLGS
ncbi:MAG TPA: hypothetical protein VHI71_06010 [Actinomycetota bacterium]|nr:hypothetical protein [Actinomycetota bacterium]